MRHSSKLAETAAACGLLILGACADAPPTGQHAAIVRLAESAQPEGENSWPLYRSLIVDTFEISLPGHRAGVDLAWSLRNPNAPGGVLYEPWDQVRTRADLALHFERMESALPRLDEAAALAGFAPPYTFDQSSLTESPNISSDGPVFAIQRPWISHMLHLAIMNLLGLREAAHASDWEEATQRIVTGMATARHLTYSPLLFEWSIAISLRWMLLDEVRRTLVEHDVPASTLRAWIDTIEYDTWPGAPSRYPLGGLRLMTLDEIAWAYAGKKYPFGGVEGESRDRLPPRSETERLADEWLDAVETWWDMPASDRPDEISFDRSLIEHNPLLKRVTRDTPESQSVRWRLDDMETRTRATLVALRVALHRAERGVLPGSLTDAMPEEDAHDPLSGRRFVYTPGEDRAGRLFTLEAPWLERHAPWRFGWKIHESMDDRSFMAAPR